MSYRQEYFVGGGGSWSSGVGRTYVGAPYQQGSGIGSFLAGAYRYVLPLLKSSAKTLGKEALSTGLNIVSDIAGCKDPKDAVRSRLRESARNLKRKADDKFEQYMNGEGYRAKRRALPSHFLNALQAASVGKKKKRKKRKTIRKKKSTRRVAKKNQNKKKKLKNRKKSVKKNKRSFPDIFD